MIIKNTLLLYIRMFISMIISLYTSRIILEILGVKDFGVYNVVGTVITSFSFISGPLSTATQRFYNFELGKKNKEGVVEVYNHSVVIYVILSLLLFAIVGISGYWFIDNKLNIPFDRIYAAKYVLLFSLFSFLIGLFKTPYESLIIANERMAFYAYMSILDVVLKLLFVYSLFVVTFDKLIAYSLGIMFITLFNFLCTFIYCYRKFGYIRKWRRLNKNTFNSLLSFSGWSLLGSLASMSQNQGLNILLNIFFGVIVNAAMGIATQVSGAINQFVANFQVAFRPQIVKNYASGNIDRLNKLISDSSKFSYLLLFAFVCPVIFNIDIILKLWLGNVPEYASEFCICMLIYALLETLSAPMWMTIQATGKIKTYQMVISSVIGLNIVLSYIFLRLGFPPETVLIIKCCLDLGYLAIRLAYIKRMVGFNIKKYFVDVIIPVIIISTLSVVFMYSICNFLEYSIINLISTVILFFILFFMLIYLVGLNRSYRISIKKFISKKIIKTNVDIT